MTRLKHAGRKKDHATQGFSLLEVVVATALLGLSVVSVMQVLATSRRSQEASRGSFKALLAADRILAEFTLAGGKSSGTYQGQQGAYAYQVTVTPQFEVAGTNSPKRLLLSLVQVRVSWREGGISKTLELATMRAATQEKSGLPGG